MPALALRAWRDALMHVFYALLQAHQCVREQRIDEAGHWHVQALGPLIQLLDMLILDPWLVHSTPLLTMGDMQVQKRLWKKLIGRGVLGRHQGSWS